MSFFKCELSIHCVHTWYDVIKMPILRKLIDLNMILINIPAGLGGRKTNSKISS